MNHMDDRKIRYFLAIAKSQSISEAAAHLGVSQSGLSRQLKQLENDLGRTLFNRTGRGVELNDIGLRLDAAVRNYYGEIDKYIDALRVQTGKYQGSIRIAMVHTLSYYFLPNLLTQFHELFPNINTYLLGRGSPEVVHLVETGKADLGFVYDVAVTSGDLIINKLFEERMSLFQHQAWNVVPPEDSHEQWNVPLITFPKYYALRRMLHREGLDANVVAEVDTVDIMLRLVSKKLGVCILPHYIQEDQIKHLGIKLEPLEANSLRRWVVSIRNNTTSQSNACLELISMAEKQAAIFSSRLQ